MNLLKTALIAVSFIVYPLSYAQDKIGVAAAVNTKTIDMVAYPGGNIENIKVDPGYKIISNRTIQTNNSGKAQMLLVDGTAFTIGPNSTVTLDKFIYDPRTASGSLEVSAKGLVRLVGGKVTKKKPALIKTSTATVGIRGGIAIVESTPEETKASFVYGVEMEVAPIENPDNSLVLTQVGLSVEVEAGSEEVEDPEVITSEELDDYSDDFEGNEEPENDESDDESNSDESNDDSESDTEKSDESENEESESEESEESDSEESESEESEESDSEESESEESEESDSEESESEESDSEESESEESNSEESDESEIEESEESDNKESEGKELGDTENKESNETDSEEPDQAENEEADKLDDSEETDAADNSNDDSSDEESSVEQGSRGSSEAESDESVNDPKSNETDEEIDQNSEDRQLSQTNENTTNKETKTETSSQDDELVETDSLENSEDLSQEDSSSSSVSTNDASNIDEESPISSTSNNDLSGNNSNNLSGQDNDENSENPITVTSSSSSEDSSPLIQTNQGKNIEDKPVVQPPTSTSSSDSVTLTQPPVTTSSSDLITLEPANEDPEPVIPEIDESLLDNFDISKNTSDTGIDNLTTAYDQGGELFIDDTQIESQEEEFIEEANEANEEVQIEEVQQEKTVEAVVEAQLSTNTSFLKNNINEDTLIGTSLGKIEIDYTGADTVRFFLGGPGSDNFEIDQQGNISLVKDLDYEESQSYQLLVFTFFGEKSVTNELVFNILDIDEDPLVDLDIISSSLSEDIETNTKFAHVEVSDPENNGISISLSGRDKDKVNISNSGSLLLSQSLDYESQKELEFIVEVFDGKNTVSKPVNIKIENVNDLKASVNLSAASVHEGTSIETSIGNVDVIGDSNLSYSLTGNDSEDFHVSADGKIKIQNNLDYSLKDAYALTLSVKGKNDEVVLPLNINISENIEPNFVTSCKNSCTFQETAPVGTVIINSSRTDADTDSLTYSLEDDFTNKFSIDSASGEVKLNESLDYESVNSYALKVIATDSKGATKEQNSVFTVGDYVLALNDKKPPSQKVKIGSLGSKERHTFTEGDLSSLNSEQRILADYSVDTPGTTYSVTGTDADKVEIDSDGILRLKSNIDWTIDETAISSESMPLYKVEVNANVPSSHNNSKIPGQENATKEVFFSPKNVEKNENLVLKFSSSFHSVDHSVKSSNPFSARAHRNKSASSGVNNQVVTESTLTKNDQIKSTFINSANENSYTQSANETSYLTSSISNGKNENDTEILDFFYRFPVDKTSSDSTYRQYAPLGVSNADWDNQVQNSEKASYGCFDSGQGCGSGNKEVNISGSMTQSTEETGSSFTGYQVKDWNINHSLHGNILLNADPDGAYAGSGAGYDDLIHDKSSVNDSSHAMFGGEAEYKELVLPEPFTYFGNTYSHIYINENGFVTFGNNSTKPYDNEGINFLSDGSNRGAYPLSFFDKEKYFVGGNGGTQNLLDGTYIPEQWGKPGSSYDGNFDNSIFALLGGYNTEGYNHPTYAGEVSDFSIRTLWNASTKVFTIGWYNLGSGKTTNEAAEVNLEIQLNLEDNSFRIIHGNFGDRFADLTNNSDARAWMLNYFTGISNDLSCQTERDISACEGKDYIQLIYFDPYEQDKDIDNWTNVRSFQDPNWGSNDDYPDAIDSMYNNYFSSPGTKRNGTNYCYTGNAGDGLSISCSSSYNSSSAKLDLDGRMYEFVPQGSGGTTKKVLLPSEIKQSFRSGLSTEFMWMHLDKDPSLISYTPPENNATGFDSGPNSRSGVNSGNLNAGSVVNHTSAKDEIIIAGEVYSEEKLSSFLGDKKKVVAFAPVPLLHTNKYELEQYQGQTDVRFRHAHTIMPNFVSTDFMESKDNGTDANFDFHQLRDDDHCKNNFDCIIYNTDGGSSFNAQDGSLSTKTEAHIDGMYGYASKVLDNDIHVASERFGDLADNANYVPVGQSLWYQVFNPNGRGVGLFSQINWSCGNNGACGADSLNKSGAPHNSQQSFFSVLIADVGDKSYFSDSSSSGYAALQTGPVIDGQHYWSYKRRDGRTTTTDGIYTRNHQSPQIAFGINPIACVSGPDNGCFFGDNQNLNSGVVGAPSTAIITTSDPCSGFGKELGMGCGQADGIKNMELGVMYSMEENSSRDLYDQSYKTETFYQGIAQQKQYDGSNYVDAINLSGTNSWRSSVTTSADTWNGRFSGLWITDVEANQKSIPMYFRAPLTASFDGTNDRVKVIANNINIYSDPDWNANNSLGDNNWFHSGGCNSDGVSWESNSCSLVHALTGNSGATLQFGDDNSQKNNLSFANSAYINKKVFGAMLKNESKNINHSNSNTSFIGANVDNAGAMVTWDTIDEKDRDTLMPCGQASCPDPEPSLDYMSWGIWAMAVNDGLEYMTGEQPSAVHMGTWYAGDLLDVSDWPVNRTAELAGMAMFNMWKSETLDGNTSNFAWTESSRADGSVVFDGLGNFNVNINVHDLGKHGCSGGINCSSGSGAQLNNFNQSAMGTVNWQINGNQGEANFGKEYSAQVNNGVTTWKAVRGSLYGSSSHVELGAELLYSKQDLNNYLQAIGTVVLSE